jgi:colanic acid/amylovoran biosynthesis protein
MVLPLVAPRGGPFSGLRAAIQSLPLAFSRRAQLRHPVARRLVDARLVVSKGGYVFVDRHSYRKLLSNWLTTLPLVIAARAGVPTAAIGATIGPFTTWYSRALNGWILRQLDLVVPRDRYSYDTALELGVAPRKLAMFPDVVFSHPGPARTLRDSIAARFDLRSRRVGVVTIAEGPGDAEFLPALRECLVRLVRSGVVDRILLVIQSDEDLDVTKGFAATMPEGTTEFIEDDLSPEELIALYSEAGFVLARRMHSAIFALVAGVPTFAVAKYALKVQGVMLALGLEDYLVDYPKVDVDALEQRIRIAMENRVEVEQRVSAAVSSARNELRSIPGALESIARKREVAASAGQPQVSGGYSSPAEQTDPGIRRSPNREVRSPS